MSRKVNYPRLYSHGFTLFELIIVIALVGILSARSMSRWITTPNVSAKTEQIAGDIRYTQSLAMTHGGYNFYIKFNPSTPATYQIVAVNLTTSATQTINSPESGGTTTTLPTGMSFNFPAGNNMPSQAITFDWLGAPYTDQAGQYTQYLKLNATVQVKLGNTTRTITIYPGTGYVEVT